MTRMHQLENQATVPSLSQLMAKVQTLSMRLGSGKRNKTESNYLIRGFKPTEIGSRMAPFLELRLI